MYMLYKYSFFGVQQVSKSDETFVTLKRVFTPPFRQVFGNLSGSKCRLTRCNRLLSIHAEFKKVSGIDAAKRVLVAGIWGLVVFLVRESSDFQADPPCQNCLIHFAQK